MWADAKQKAEEGDFDSIAPELLIKHLNAFLQIRNMAISKHTPMENVLLRPWQQDLMNILQGPVNKRHIYWYWETTGDVGKSFMADYLARNHKALKLGNAKSADVAYMFQPTSIVVFDFPKSQKLDEVNYRVMEDIKNGSIMSTKYMSCVKYFDVPHVVVFANGPCPEGKFSRDRIQEVQIPSGEPRALAEGFVPPPLRRQRLNDSDDFLNFEPW